MAVTVALTTVQPDDEHAFYALYAAVRTGELVMDGWPAALRETIVRQQFDAQRRSHRAGHPAAREMLILIDGRPAGWAVLDRSAAPWHLLDIAIAADRRREGIGTRLLQDWQAQAAAAGCGIALSVLRTNVPARTLYDRLGFRVTAESETHWRMEWRA